MTAIPKDIQFDERQVRILWSDGHQSVYTNRKLRDECPCAVCKGESGVLGEMYAPANKPPIPEDVRVARHSMIGRYAISFTWSDGHGTGIYPYDYLLALCECEKCRGRQRPNQPM